MELDPKTVPHQSMYKILTGSVVPRPIGWISSLNAEGRRNLAPFSFFNVVCANPPTVLFCPMIRGADASEKDTLRNVRATGEFVVNIVSESVVAGMNMSSAELHHEMDEFEFAGLMPVPSVVVKPPRVAGSLIHFECKVHQIIEISNQPGGGSIVIGTVVHVHVDESVLIGTDKINLSVLQPLGRLAGASYTRVTDTFDLERPPAQLEKKN